MAHSPSKMHRVVTCRRESRREVPLPASRRSSASSSAMCAPQPATQSQEALARALQAERTTVTKIETGARPPNDKLLAVVAGHVRGHWPATDGPRGSRGARPRQGRPSASQGRAVVRDRGPGPHAALLGAGDRARAWCRPRRTPGNCSRQWAWMTPRSRSSSRSAWAAGDHRPPGAARRHDRAVGARAAPPDRDARSHARPARPLRGHVPPARDDDPRAAVQPGSQPRARRRDQPCRHRRRPGTAAQRRAGRGPTEPRPDSSAQGTRYLYYVRADALNRPDSRNRLMEAMERWST